MKNSIFKNKSIKSFLDFFSRVSISAIFISAIPGKINSFERTVETSVQADYLSRLETSAINASASHEFCDTAIFRLSQVLRANQHWSFFFASQTKI